MQLTVEPLALEAALRIVSKSCGLSGADTSVNFKVQKDQLSISGTNKGTSIEYKLPCKVIKKTENATFTLGISSLSAAIHNKKKITLEVKTGVLQVRSDRYVVDLVTQTAEDIVVLPEAVLSGKVKTMKMSQEVVEFLSKAVADVDMKPVLESSDHQFMPVAIRLNDKGALVVCYDNWHMAFVSSKAVTGDLTLCLPASSLGLLTREFKGMSYKLLATDAILYAYNNTFALALTLPQQEEQNSIPFEEAFRLATDIRKTKGIPVTLNADDMGDVTVNINAVYKRGEHVSFSVKGDTCTVGVKSAHGRVTAGVRCKAEKNVNFRTGFSFLRDSLTKVAGKKIELQVVPNRMMYFTSGHKTVMMALLPEDGDD